MTAPVLTPCPDRVGTGTCGGGLLAAWAHRRTMARLEASDQIAAHVIAIHSHRGALQ